MTADKAGSLRSIDISSPQHPLLMGGSSTRPYSSEYAAVPYTQAVESVKISDELLIPAGRHTLQPEEVSARQRERLLRAMGRCVSDQGYVETTIADVVRYARTSRSVFYKHFADKQECFLETYREMTDVRIAGWQAAAAEVSAWDEKLDAAIAAYFRWMSEHPEVAVTTIVEVHSAGRQAQEERGRALAAWTKTVRGLAALARMQGFDVQIDEAAAFAIVLTAEAYVHEYARKRRLDEVVERTGAVQALARSLFARDFCAGEGRDQSAARREQNRVPGVTGRGS
jgi:AcrR family transcriptional regulator